MSLTPGGLLYDYLTRLGLHSGDVRDFVRQNPFESTWTIQPSNSDAPTAGLDKDETDDNIKIS